MVIEDFPELSQIEGLTIHHDLLHKYEIHTAEISHNNVIRLLSQNGFEDNIDHLLKVEPVE